MVNIGRIPPPIGFPARFFGYLLLALFASSAFGQDWQISPEIAAGYEYDDNAELSIRTDDVVELNGLLAEASVDVDYLSETTEFGFTPLVRRRTYPGDPEFDATEIAARLNYRFETIKSTWRIDGRLNRSPVRNAERVDDDLDIQDPDDILDDDSGLVGLGGDRDRLILRPSWTYRWSNVSSTKLQVDYRAVNYNETFVFLQPYSDTTLLANYRYGFSTRTSGFVEGSVRRYEDDAFSEFDTIALGIGLETQVTPTFRIRARIGAEEVESARTGISKIQPVGELSFIRRIETIRLLAQYRRTVSSTGSGNMSERDSINVNFTRDLTERFEAGLGVRAYQNRPINLSGIEIGGFEREYLQLTARFTWNITRSFALRTTYQYTVSSRQIEGESANSNQIVAWLIFRPTGIRDER
jgi:hypothetical protein